MKASKPPCALFVLGIEPLRIGGIELLLRVTAEHLAARGWRCVICFNNRPPEPVLSYLSLPNVIWDEVPKAWDVTVQSAKDLSSVIRRHRPRILHLLFTPSLGMYPWIARLHGIRQIYFTDQGSRPEGYVAQPASPLKRQLGGFINGPITKVIGISDYNCRTTLDRGYMDVSRVTRIYNGSDMTLDVHSGKGGAFRSRYGIPENRILVTQVSWMIPEKGILDLIEAARLAVAAEPDLHFAMVGEGAQRAAFTEKASQAGIADHVTWTGLIQEPHGCGVFAATDIACQMSRWEEAFGLVISEAMVYRKPLVATRVGGIPELVKDGETGFLVERGDSATMAARILELARDPHLRRRMGEAGRAHAEANFDIQKTTAQLMKVYGLP